ncbi:putative membrane protein [Halarchaeum solikamskense]|nr:putative membrane protein [Halarchaeum solikamskense]
MAADFLYRRAVIEDMGDTATDDDDDDGADVSDLMDDLEALEAHVESEEAREAVAEAMETAVELRHGGTFGRVIRGFDRADAAEAALGSVLFAIPMVVEGGTHDVGAYVAAHVGHLFGTLCATVAMVYGILYVAEIQDVRVKNPIFGVIPRRLAGVVTISMGVTTLLFTGWGQVDWTAEPWLSACVVAVAWVPTAVGAALSDILPGS